MFTISLHNLIFYSFHGIYEEEKIIDNTFNVNVSLSFLGHEHISIIEQSINYAAVYEIIKQRMLIPTPLLEILAQEIAQLIFNFDDRIKSISTSIEKKNPPISGIQGSVSIDYKKDF